MNKPKVTLLSRAQSDLSECVNYLLNVSEEAATKLAKDIFEAIDLMALYPQKNPIFEMPKTFTFIVRKQVVNKRYIILYPEVLTEIFIYRILDARRNFDGLLE